jgi:hypothetical protein
MAEVTQHPSASTEQARPRFRDVLFSQGLAPDRSAEANEERDQALELMRSPAFPWLLGVLRKARDGAAMEEAKAIREGRMYAAAYASAVRDNSDGFIRFILQYAMEKEMTGPVLRERRIGYLRRLGRAILGKA